MLGASLPPFLLLQHALQLLCISPAGGMLPLLFYAQLVSVGWLEIRCQYCAHLVPGVLIFWFISPFWWSTSSGSLLRKGMWKINLEGPWISMSPPLHLIDALCEILGRKYFTSEFEAISSLLYSFWFCCSEIFQHSYDVCIQPSPWVFWNFPLMCVMWYESTFIQCVGRSVGF